MFEDIEMELGDSEWSGVESMCVHFRSLILKALNIKRIESTRATLDFYSLSSRLCVT